DRESIEGDEARLAVGEDRLRASVRNPAAAGTRHASFGHDPYAALRTAAAERAGKQSLVVSKLVRAVSIRARRIEHGDTGLGGGRGRFDSSLLVAILI